MLELEHFPKIDAHFHSTFYNPVYEKIAKDYHVKYININTDASVFPRMEVQENVALAYVKKAPEHFAYIASFEMQGWENPNWHRSVFDRLKKSVDQGAVGVKIWKNIGMEILKPSDSSFLMIDDPFFDPLFVYLSENKIPVLTHLGEPKNCWLPIQEMTSERNKVYYTKNPEFHAYLHPEIPAYKRQIEARDYLMDKYPDLTLIGAHLGSLEWSYEELAKRFDRYSNFYVDLSSRLGHLQMQSVNDYEGVRDFFIKYADRIMYGTDAYNNPEKLTSSLINDWKYFTTNKQCESIEVNGTFKGIHLPEEVLYQLYYTNAQSIYPGLNVEIHS
ncbi:putative TIM-barrel fold metal-dependent hydrolase [Pedobacter cryoconitis]|uniref:Putative TIM-barrel fold metal-dependent hydrolase n=1 Tax=Pedobacter cryoconitis TaxID=188932 RepID=A0A7W9DK39_9SPHI|nr:amidohydrolase family protein [Pedobacter cryoconitis]MBB5620815.1 putative TIM-barrel fold metal-dependent hydrolase [Pedobacter cryoconitis]MBB5645986.1 putative TIM-barrel fold metal-dependent hydrolase [Pedobacter cryoconitis]